jgi:hypothetical protein
MSPLIFLMHRGNIFAMNRETDSATARFFDKPKALRGPKLG